MPHHVTGEHVVVFIKGERLAMDNEDGDQRLNEDERGGDTPQDTCRHRLHDSPFIAELALWVLAGKDVPEERG
jgi:hypothetical protein